MSSKKTQPSCQAEACSLQACLNKNTYTPDKCSAQMQKFYQCCARVHDITGGRDESTVCPMPSVVRRWLENHST